MFTLHGMGARYEDGKVHIALVARVIICTRYKLSTGVWWMLVCVVAEHVQGASWAY